MKPFKILFLTIATICVSTLKSYCAPDTTRELKVGDKVPPVLISGITDHGQQEVKLETLYRKGLLIINFWATWCVPCVGEMKKLTAFESRMPRLSVLSVCHDKPAVVASFLNKQPEINPRLLYITSDDKLLTRVFPNSYLPHNVWIDSTGTVVAITGGEDLDEDNITRFIKGEKTTLAVKHDSLNFSWLKPLHVEDSALVYRSIIAHYNPNLNSGDVTYIFNWRRFFGWNVPITDLYWLAYCKQFCQNINRDLIELHTNDSVKFFSPYRNRRLFDHSRYHQGDKFAKEELNWEKDNLYCYELRLPDQVNEDIFRSAMLQDLNRFFKTRGTIEQRKRACEAITIADKATPMLQTKDDHQKAYLTQTDTGITCRNVSLDDFFLRISDDHNPDGELFVNKTGITRGVDITIAYQGEPPTMATIKKRLQEKYGLHFKKKTCAYPVLVLNDLN